MTVIRSISMKKVSFCSNLVSLQLDKALVLLLILLIRQVGSVDFERQNVILTLEEGLNIEELVSRKFSVR